jgi:dTDP-4-dehydrorhamnose reductase
MRLLIIGGSGLLGLNWAVQVRARDSVHLSWNLHKPSLAGVETLQLDVLDDDSIEQTIAAVAPDVCVHAAALTNVDQCEIRPNFARQLNAQQAAKVASVCADRNIKLVMISTDQLFSGTEQFVDESCIPNPLNVYGTTKYEAESRVMQISSDALIIRTNFFGWGSAIRSSFSDHIIRSLRSATPIGLFDDVYYTPIAISQLVDAISSLIAANQTGIYNVVGSERLTKYAFGLRLASYFRLDANLIERASIGDVGLRAPRPLDMSLSNRKLLKILGREEISLDDGISQLFNQEVCGTAEEIHSHFKSFGLDSDRKRAEHDSIR